MRKHIGARAPAPPDGRPASPQESILRAEGVLMAVYGLGAAEAGTVLRMRAGLLNLDVHHLAVRVVERASQLVLDRPTRLQVSELLDLVGTEARPLV